MKLIDYDHFKSIRSYFGFESSQHYEICDFNTAVNHLENEMYLNLEATEDIEAKGKELEMKSQAIDSLNDFGNKYSEILSPLSQGHFINLIKQLIAEKKYDLNYFQGFYKPGKKRLPISVMFWLIKALESSVKESGSYELFRLYMLDAYNNYFFFNSKRDLKLIHDIFRFDEMPDFYHLPVIPSLKPVDNGWARSLKQTLKKSVNMEVPSFIDLIGVSNRKYELLCKENSIHPIRYEDINILIFLEQLKLNKSQPLLFPITDEQLEAMNIETKPLLDELRKNEVDLSTAIRHML